MKGTIFSKMVPFRLCKRTVQACNCPVIIQPHMTVMDITTASPCRPHFPNRIEAAIFDMDGTLLDTEAAQHRAFVEAGKRIGAPVPSHILDAMVGINQDANERMLAAVLGPTFPITAFYEEADLLFEAAVEAGLPLRPGTKAILDYFVEQRIPIALATSTVGGKAQDRLASVGLLDYFDVIVTRSDVAEPKPSPEPYLLAARLLGFEPGECLAVEDSYAGVQSATSAGIPTIMIPDLLPAAPEQERVVVAVLPSLNELKDHLEVRNALDAVMLSSTPR